MIFSSKQPIQSKHIKIPGIGQVKITRRRKCRNLCIRVHKSSDVRVTIPFRTGFDEGEKFVFEKIDWIRKAIEKMALTEPAQKSFTFQYELTTRSRTIRIKPNESNKYILRIEKGETNILVPALDDLTNVAVQATINNMIIEALRNEAKDYLPIRTQQLANLHGFKIRDIRVKNAITRWGSCSVNNNINLNIHLVRLPDELSDYIILHELVHTIHKNHGPKFWDLLEKVSGNAKEKSKKLKKFKLGLFD